MGILTEPENSLVKQYRALMKTEELELDITPDGIEEIATLSAEINSSVENIGALARDTDLSTLIP